MKNLPFMLICLMSLLTVGCGHKSKTVNESEPVIEVEEVFDYYENDYIGFNYPNGMVVNEEVNNAADSLQSLKPGFTIDVYGYGVPYSFRFVKSVMFDVFDTPEGWRDLSLTLKAMTDSTYIGCYNQEDSLSFNGYPMATATMAFKRDYPDDTLLHYQMVVLKDNKDLFYLNYSAPINEFGNNVEIANEVMRSVVLK